MGKLSDYVTIVLLLVGAALLYGVVPLFHWPSWFQFPFMDVFTYAGLRWAKLLLWPKPMRYVKDNGDRPVALAVVRFAMANLSVLIVLLLVVPFVLVGHGAYLLWPGLIKEAPSLNAGTLFGTVLVVGMFAAISRVYDYLQGIGWMPMTAREVGWARFEKSMGADDAQYSSETHRCERCFLVDGRLPHYYLELDDGRTIHISGLSLKDFLLEQAGKKRKKRKTFPCTKFTVRRHAGSEYFVEVACSGEVIEPEFVSREYTREKVRPAGPKTARSCPWAAMNASSGSAWRSRGDFRIRRRRGRNPVSQHAGAKFEFDPGARAAGRARLRPARRDLNLVCRCLAIRSGKALPKSL